LRYSIERAWMPTGGTDGTGSLGVRGLRAVSRPHRGGAVMSPASHLPSESRAHLEREKRIVYIPQKMKLLLLFFSLFHRSACRVKSWLYSRKAFKPEKAPLPVISVGNIIFGGSGKTPMVMNLLSFLVQNGLKPALISRGYKGKWERTGGILSDGKTIQGTWQDSGEEAYLVASKIPQSGAFVGKDRLTSCRMARDAGFEIAVLDDGFQHLRLQRDLDIVLYDPAEKIALREPVSALKRARIILIEKRAGAGAKGRLKKRFPQSDIFEYEVQNRGFFRPGKNEQESRDRLEQKRVLAFCGIARPQRFLTQLQKENIRPACLLKFPDHHSYPLPSVKRISETFGRIKAEAIITTEKDAVKISDAKDLARLPVYYLKIDLELERAFYLNISSLLERREQ